MNTTERRTKAADLLKLVDANPDNPSAGAFAQAAADLLAQCDRHEEQSHIREKTPELISLVKQMTEAMNRKPADAPKTTAEQSVKQSVANAVARTLVMQAIQAEQAAVRLDMSESELDISRKSAQIYRDRAVAVLTEAGLTDIGYPLIDGCA